MIDKSLAKTSRKCCTISDDSPSLFQPYLEPADAYCFVIELEVELLVLMILYYIMSSVYVSFQG
jgi:hypothetical protein